MFRFSSIKTEWPFWAFVTLTVAFAAAWTGTVVGYAVALGFFALATDAFYATVRWHRDYRTPKLIAFKEAIERRWDDYASPVRFMQTASRRFQLVRSYGLDFFEIYDENGRLTGTEQEIDWNMSNDDPADVHPSNVQVIEQVAEKPYRLSWLARWRSKDAIKQAQAWKAQKQKN